MYTSSEDRNNPNISFSTLFYAVGFGAEKKNKAYQIIVR